MSDDRFPSLSDADPETAGEGSLDPLGLAAFADRLANLLAPDLRARMYRIRFVTAIAVGAILTDGLWDVPAGDGVSTPPICFEWVVLEAFVRRGKETGVLESRGVPGSAKARAVIARGKRLDAANYLKAPSVFGFNGVYQPLARGFRIVDEDRMPAERAPTLVSTWESEQGFVGFLDRRPGSDGARFRDRLLDAVRLALHAGHCVTPTTAQLWLQIARSLPPLEAGPRERALLRSWLLDAEQPLRVELARALGGLAWTNEARLLKSISSRASDELRRLINAVFSYENFCGRLDAVFVTLRHISTLQGMQPLNVSDAATNPVVRQAARELPAAYARMAQALEAVEMMLPVEADLGAFGETLSPAELIERVLDRHGAVQRRKGKRNWLEEYGHGVIVRPSFRQNEPIAIDDLTFLHPFRVVALWQFMDDTRS